MSAHAPHPCGSASPAFLQGTYAKVKYAQHMDTGEAVALKVLDKEHLVRTGMVEQVKQEISILKRVHHPNVVDLMEVMSSKEKIYMVMELVTGGDLFDKIAAEGPMKEGPARVLFSQLLSALGYIHSKGVYHRDLKPENVLLSSEGDAKLSDFGLGTVRQADTIESAGMLNTICGTPNYAAPEVLAKQAYDGAMADIWSLGVVLYVMLAGCLPFDEDDLVSLFQKISTAEYEMPPWITTEAASIISAMLQADPAGRATTDDLWAHPWMAGMSRLATIPETQQLTEEELSSKGGNDYSRSASIADSVDIFEPTVSKTSMSPSASAARLSSGKTSMGSTNSSVDGSSPSRRLNAFQLINDYLDISAMFEARDDVVSRHTRFTSTAPPREILDAIENATVAVGGRVEKRGEDWARVYLPNKKGPIRMVCRVLEVLQGKRIVDLQKISGNTVEFYSWYHDLAAALDSLVSKERRSVMAGPRPSSALRTKQRLNAFELIGSTFNVGAMFDLEEDSSVRHVQFSSRATVPEIVKAIAEGTRALGGEALLGEAGALLKLKVPVGQGRTLPITVRMFELLPGVQVVQLVKNAGSMPDLYKFYNRLATGHLGDIMMRRHDGRLTHPQASNADSVLGSIDTSSLFSSLRRNSSGSVEPAGGSPPASVVDGEGAIP